jgi:ubiquinone/menaquinone biosynthesis C-methylase UbiE
MMGVFRTPLLFILVEDDMDAKRQKQELNETKELCKETFGSYAYVYEDEE